VVWYADYPTDDRLPRLISARRLHVTLADAVGELLQPVNGLPFRNGEARMVGQGLNHRPEIGPAPIKIDQIARHGRLALLTLSLFGIFFGSGHG
jgi:hypothetical protein